MEKGFTITYEYGDNLYVHCRDDGSRCRKSVFP